jgi:predicted flap endonuclease-1-like 5' DNA nuclease
MPDSLMDIEGIEQRYAKALNEAGLRTTDDLLINAGSASGRKSLAERIGVDDGRILDWVNRADLMRINGVGSEYADLLEAAGVDTVKELSNRVPQNLQTKMSEMNETKHLVRRVPSMGEVETWVSEAKRLPAMVSY